MNIIDINGFPVGGDSVYIIADIGSNHMQDLQLAKKSIDAVAKAGANAVKFQSIQLNEIYLNPDDATADFIKKLEFPEEWHKILKEYCDKRNITFFSSPTYLKSVDIMEEIDVKLYKLASAQIGTFPQLVEKVASLKKPTIFSTGIVGYDEVVKAVSIFKENNNADFIILHCNSIYPTPPEKVNLQLIKTYEQMFGNPVGFSDHTVGTHIATAAVTMGAKVIEKHFTLDRTFNSPDSNEFASDPEEFSKLIREIRDVEKSKNIFYDRLRIQNEEQEFKDTIAYKIVSKKDIFRDELITLENIQYLRNNEGINCKNSDEVIGKRALKDIKINSPINLSDLI